MEDKPLAVERTMIEREPDDSSVLTFSDKDGRKLKAALSPIAAQQLLMALLAAWKGEQVGSQFRLTMPPIAALDFKSFILDRDHAGLEIVIRPGAAIHIGFDNQRFQKLESEIQKLKTPAPAAGRGKTQQ